MGYLSVRNVRSQATPAHRPPRVPVLGNVGPSHAPWSWHPRTERPSTSLRPRRNPAPALGRRPRSNPAPLVVRLELPGGLDRRSVRSRTAAGTGRRTELRPENYASQLFPVALGRLP